MELGLDGLPRMTAKEVADYLSLAKEEREKFDAARKRRMEESERKEEMELAIAWLSWLELPITSIKDGVITIDFNLSPAKKG
jgi:hypothetical protein